MVIDCIQGLLLASKDFSYELACTTKASLIMVADELRFRMLENSYHPRMNPSRYPHSSRVFTFRLFVLVVTRIREQAKAKF